MKSAFGIPLLVLFVLASCTPVPRPGSGGTAQAITPSQTSAELSTQTSQPTVIPSQTATSLPTITSPQVINTILELGTLPDVISIKEMVTGIDELDQGAIYYEILYLSDGYTVVGYVAAPRDYLERMEPYPVLVYNRGGNGDYGAVNSNFPPQIAIQFNAIVLISQYRETREGTGKDEFGGDDVHDVIKLLDFIDLCTFADQDHIVMLGESRGSIMTFEVIRVDDRIKAAIVTGSVPDLVSVYNFRNQQMKGVLVYRVGGTPEEVPGEYTKRSAIQWVEEIDVPLLVFHTEDDTRAPIGPVDEFVSRLESLGNEVTYIRKEEGGHCWSDMDMILEFFNKYTR